MKEQQLLPLVVGPKEAAKLLSLTERYVWELIKSKKLKAQRIGKYWRIPVAEIEKFLDGKS